MTTGDDEYGAAQRKQPVMSRREGGNTNNRRGRSKREIDRARKRVGKRTQEEAVEEVIKRFYGGLTEDPPAK
jgi:hypothetical protein